MITIGSNQQVGQCVGEMVLANERVGQQRSEHPFPATTNGSLER